MDYSFAHELGACAYVGDVEAGELRRWLGWYRRRGVEAFYLYCEENSSLRAELQREILAGWVVLMYIASSYAKDKSLMAYGDCVKRVRYACRYLALLRVGEYLQGLGEQSMQLIVEKCFGNYTAALEIEGSDGSNRYVANPLCIIDIDENGNIYSPENYKLRTVKGLFFSHERKKSIALLSHVMARNGAPLALLSVAKILKEAGYEVEVYSILPGPMEKEFEKLGIPVTIDPKVHGIPLEDQPWYREYDLIFVNTAVMVGCFRKELTGPHVIWWLHESKSILEWCGIKAENISDLKHERVHALAVSEVARRDFADLAPYFPVEGILTLGVADSFTGRAREKKPGDAFVFMMTGTVEKRKGQDIFLKAIGLMKEENRKKCRFYLVGESGQSTEPGYEDEVRSLAARYPEVELMPFQPHEKILEMYGNIDALVVPSREETLSIVAVEAMMMEVPCIVSDSTGVASFIENEKSGLIFSKENQHELANEMQMILEDNDKYCLIKKSGRCLYEETFKLCRFEKKLKELTEKLFET
ncbi:glycosyltransferase family 4 protein [Selenomonas sp. AB3002]|uniref:glycosyltransferase family 4 protein n=1 Tax=Selenomonas sp. AB3002 TaxID=1392502 RepID=UPI000495F51F